MNPIVELLTRTITGHVDERFDQLNTCRPGKIETYNAATGLASVKSLIQKAYRDEKEERQVAPLPVIPNVPVVFPGSGGIRIKFPVLPGDLVLLLFSSASLDRWLVSGDDVDPADDRANAITDAIAIPGLLNRARDASPQIEFTLTGQIHAGGSGRAGYEGGSGSTARLDPGRAGRHRLRLPTQDVDQRSYPGVAGRDERPQGRVTATPPVRARRRRISARRPRLY
jgi:hypothetical protein